MRNDGSAPRTLIELLMEVVAPIVGGITVAITLRTWTSMPTWACLLIALPVGTVLGWLTMIGTFVIVSFVFKSSRRRIGEQSHALEPAAGSDSNGESSPSAQ